MLTVLIHSGDNAEALVRTLQSVFPAIAEGIVRDGAILCAQAGAAVRAVADAAGCEVFAGAAGQAAQAALARARAGHALLLCEGAQLDDGWWREAARFVESGRGADPACASFRLPGGPVAEGLRRLRERVTGRPDPRRGLIAPVWLLSAAAASGSLRPRSLGRVALLDAAIRPA